MAVAQSGDTPPLIAVERLPFLHDKGDSGRRYIVETMGSGGALFDVDADGDLDLYLLNGAPLPGCARPPRGNAVLLNDGAGNFSAAADARGLADTGYGMGCCVGDIDNDGDPDVYVTNFGRNRLLRNDGGRFTDTTDVAGVGDERWGASAGFADFDRDGDLDLYVTNYLAFTIAVHKECSLGKGIPAYCSPDAYPAARDVLYLNNGDGTFVDATAAWGIAAPSADASGGKGLGVLCLDYDRDGYVDVYVANDGVANTLYRNVGGKRFEDATLIAGVGYNDDGMAQAGMGVTAADFVGDGFPEIFVTNLSSETNVLYRSRGHDWFEDATVSARLGAASRLYTGFGTVSGDFDADGDVDLFVANGHVIDNIRQFYDYYDYKQCDQWFENSAGVFTEQTRRWVAQESAPVEAGRGAMLGDVDGDGDLDCVVTNCGGPALLYRSSMSTLARHWITIELQGILPRDPVGARVEIVAGGKKQMAAWHGGGSYLCHDDTRLYFGLGKAKKVEQVVVTWPRTGQRTVLQDVAVDRVLQVTEPEAAPKPKGTTQPKRATS
ncbi:MAG: CRTAC1 family protein, partial [Planctomycetota bacterium]